MADVEPKVGVAKIVSSLGHGSSAAHPDVVDKGVELHMPAAKLAIVGPSYRQEGNGSQSIRTRKLYSIFEASQRTRVLTEYASVAVVYLGEDMT